MTLYCPYTEEEHEAIQQRFAASLLETAAKMDAEKQVKDDRGTNEEISK